MISISNDQHLWDALFELAGPAGTGDRFVMARLLLALRQGAVTLCSVWLVSLQWQHLLC